jgi:hypothetical protein
MKTLEIRGLELTPQLLEALRAGAQVNVEPGKHTQVGITLGGVRLFDADVRKVHLVDGGLRLDLLEPRPAPTSIPSSGTPRRDEP